MTRPHVGANRPILVPPVPVSEGFEIRHVCQFLSSLVRVLAKLPGGLGRFLPRRIGSHMSRLRRLGWNQCSHGLTSRPLESCHHQCLKAVCGVLTLFTMRFTPWSLPGVGNVSGKRQFVTPGQLLDESGQVGKRLWQTRKTRPGASSHVIPDPGQPTLRRWKRLRHPSSEGVGSVGEPRNLFPRLGVG